MLVRGENGKLRESSVYEEGVFAYPPKFDKGHYGHHYYKLNLATILLSSTVIPSPEMEGQVEATLAAIPAIFNDLIGVNSVLIKLLLGTTVHTLSASENQWRELHGTASRTVQSQNY